MKSRTSQMWILIAFGFGVLMTWMGNRPNWRPIWVDTGIVGGLILISTLMLGFSSPKQSWIGMLVIGGGISLVDLLVTQTAGSVVALILTVIGASAGALGRKVVSVFQTAFA